MFQRLLHAVESVVRFPFRVLHALILRRRMHAGRRH